MRLLCILFVIASLSVVYAQKPLTLEEMKSLAITNSYELSKQQKNIEATESSVPVLSNLPDPQVTLGLMNMPVNSFSFTQEPMTGKQISISQKFPFPGKLQTQAELTESEVPIFEADISRTKDRIAYEVSSLYYSLCLIEESITTVKQNTDILNGLSAVVKTKYEVSKASQSDILDIELAISEQKDKLIELKAERKAIYGKLKSMLLINEPFTVAIVKLDSLTITLPEQEALIALAIDNNPSLLKSRLNEKKMRIKEKKASENYYPDFSVSVSYSQRDYIEKTDTNLDDFISFAVGFSIPIGYGGKYAAEEETTILMQEYYKEEYRAKIQSIETSVSGIYEYVVGLKEQETYLRDVSLIQATQLYNAKLAGYQTGETDFDEVMKALKRMITIDLKAYQVRAKMHMKKAELENVIGTSLQKSEVLNKE